MASEAFWDGEAKDDLEETLLGVWGVPDGQFEATTQIVLDLVYARAPLTLPLRRILDVGCGPGRMAIPFARRVPESEVVGCDISEKMLDLARSQNGPANLRWVKCDGETIPIDDPVTLAYEVVVFQHNEPHICAALTAEVARLLEPGGVFVFQTIENIDFDDWGHLAPEVPAFWATDAGLEVIGTERGVIYPDWLWTIARKP